MRTLRAEYGDGTGGEESRLHFFAANPDIADGASDSLYEEEFLGVVGAGVCQERGRHPPHVTP